MGYKEIKEILNDTFIYSNLFYLEYKNENILKSFKKTGKELGLKDDEIIFLKINKDIFDLNQNYQFLTEIKFRNLNEIKKFIFPSLKSGKINEQELNKILAFNCGILNYYYYNNKSCCEIYRRNQIDGGGAGPIIDFVNVEKGIVKNLKFDKDAPKWRKVKRKA